MRRCEELFPNLVRARALPVVMAVPVEDAEEELPPAEPERQHPGAAFVEPHDGDEHSEFETWLNWVADVVEQQAQARTERPARQSSRRGLQATWNEKITNFLL